MFTTSSKIIICFLIRNVSAGQYSQFKLDQDHNLRILLRVGQLNYKSQLLLIGLGLYGSLLLIDFLRRLSFYLEKLPKTQKIDST